MTRKKEELKLKSVDRMKFDKTGEPRGKYEKS